VIESFNFYPFPRLIFGTGKIKELPGLINRISDHVLIVLGKKSFSETEYYQSLVLQLEQKKISFSVEHVGNEPDPSLVDNIVNQFRDQKIGVVVSIGGGSVIDTGKAVSAMYFKQESVKDYLEGVGTGIKHDGKKLPFIAVPTTAGTGSEATKNAVISEVGKNGFKKSLRHDRFIPDYALIDPQLSLKCPSRITAACAMDAFSQLLESYLSTQSNPISDALCVSGIEKIIKSIWDVCQNGDKNIEARENLSYAAFLSGVTLANAGLGAVHGLASVIGGRFEIPHGVVCGVLVEPVFKYSVEKLKLDQSPESRFYLNKIAKIGSLISKKKDQCLDQSLEVFLEFLSDLKEKLQLSNLSDYGIKEMHVSEIVEKSGIKNHPVQLSPKELKLILS